MIGVTARQRVELPRPGYYPCLDTANPYFKGTKEDHYGLTSPPCWKCYAAYYLSPCPLQGFEFEGAVIISLAMFNLIEVLPVMPGPCQLFNWEKLKNNAVTSEYFKLLMHTEKTKRSSSPYIFNRRYQKVKLPDKEISALTATQTAVSDKTMTPTAAKKTITWTEFLYANMRLAEDRVLSFVSVFSTGYGTKWIPGAAHILYHQVLYVNPLMSDR